MLATDDTVQLEVHLELPRSIAREAERGGLLTSESLEALLRDAIRRRRVDRLFKAADRLAALPDASLTETEIVAEIQASRRERHAPDAALYAEFAEEDRQLAEDGMEDYADMLTAEDTP